MRLLPFVLFALLVVFIDESEATANASAKLLCSADRDCATPNGQCLSNECVCSRGWLIVDRSGCTYEQKSKLTAFLLSFFVGIFGVDWFYLSVGSWVYILLGVLKLLTCGGLGIWWIVDWIRLLVNAFLDGNGVPLLDWSR